MSEMLTADGWYAPYYMTSVDGRWRISRARVDGVWRYTLWAFAGDGKSKAIGTFDSLESAKGAAK